MPKLPVISGKKAIATLTKLGFKAVRQRGSHIVLKKKASDGFVVCVVPLHRELAIGTLNGILHQARVEAVEFIDALK